MEKMIFTLTEQMKDALQLLQRTVTVKKGSGGAYPEGVLFYKDNLAAISADLSITYKLTSDETGFVSQLFDERVIVPVKGLQVILDSVENSEITLSVENNILSVKKNSKRGVAQMRSQTSISPIFRRLMWRERTLYPLRSFCTRSRRRATRCPRTSRSPCIPACT